jgi:hypothetical protein
MSDEIYFKLYGNEDGVFVEKISNIEEFLTECLKENIEILFDFSETPWDKTRTKFSGDSINEKEQVIIIKGKIVLPKKVKVVEKYEI